MSITFQRNAQKGEPKSFKNNLKQKQEDGYAYTNFWTFAKNKQNQA